MSLKPPGKAALLLTATLLFLLLLSGCATNQLIEIQPPPDNAGEFGYVYIGGNVTVPGLYPIKDGDTLEALLQAAGGGTDPGSLRLLVLADGQNEGPQLIDINRAEVWLLSALPGIGETKAQAIVDYRNTSGPFGLTQEIMRVPGIGQGTYEEIKDYITVSG